MYALPRSRAASRPWSPLSDAAWSALLPFLDHPAPGASRRPGRPIVNLRARMDLIFQAVTSGLPWSRFSTPQARTDTIHRQFRRLAHAGLWSRLLRRPPRPGLAEALRHARALLRAARGRRRIPASLRCR
ncbi:transposase [Roseomonas sp. E05]|uniref:transposase n=1 Tax=Roseomonas sp. E05 TaxID=3046310 RepID=UPI0024BAB750|nr:transposase [Roseomonas sp. E05]MDJ0391215.1 transposase [Roseomonas sp. E05]